MRVLRAVRAVWPVIVLSALLWVISLSVSSSAPVEIWLINTILTVGLYVFVGTSGVMSFGHASFMAVGAYAAALLTIPVTTKEVLLPDLPSAIQAVELPTVPAFILTALAAALIGYVVGLPLMRLSGLAAGIATLALLVITSNILQNYEPLGGSGTLTGISIDATREVIVVWGIVVLAAAYVFQNSRVGLRLRASRDDEAAARSIGVRVERDRRIAFALSAAITAVGGALYGHHLGSISANAFYFATTILIIGMLVIGGRNSLTGAVVGALAVSVAIWVLDTWEAGSGVAGLQLDLPAGSRSIVFAALTIAILFLRPAGITGGKEVPWLFGVRQLARRAKRS